MRKFTSIQNNVHRNYSSCFYCPRGKSKDTNEWGWIKRSNWINIKQEILKIKEFSSTLYNFQALLGCLEALSRPLSLFKDFSRQAFIFKYFSFLYEPWKMLWPLVLGENSKYLLCGEKNFLRLVLHLGLISLTQWPLVLLNGSTSSLLLISLT